MVMQHFLPFSRGWAPKAALNIERELFEPSAWEVRLALKRSMHMRCLSREEEGARGFRPQA